MTKAAELAKIISASGVVSGVGFTAGNAVLAEAELELLDGLTAGTAIASKVITTDANIDSTGMRNLTISGELDAATLDISGNVDIDGTLETDAFSIASTAVTSTAAELNILDGVTSTATELNLLDGVTSTTAELNILDGVTSTAAELNILDGVTASATDINLIDGITNGTVIASKAIITDSNKDITGGRNITISGELDAASLDISGNIDVDGVTNLDVTDIDGTLNVAGETTLQTHLNMGDEDKIKLGASGDLEIFHDGNNSFIKDTGTGSLYLQASDSVFITNASGNENKARFDTDGAVTLYHNNAAKIATTSSGVTVTGGVTTTTASSIEGGAVFNEASADVDFRVEGNGDTHALFVQGGSDHVGINNNSPNSSFTGADNLVIGGGSGHTGMTILSGTSSRSSIEFSDGTGSDAAKTAGGIRYYHDSNYMRFNTDVGTERMRITSAGKLLVGTTSDDGDVDLGNKIIGGIFATRAKVHTFSAVNTFETVETFANNAGTYLLTATGSGGGNASTDHYIGFVSISGSSAVITDLKTASRVLVQMSGLSLQIRQGFFSTANITYSLLRLVS